MAKRTATFLSQATRRVRQEHRRVEKASKRAHLLCRLLLVLPLLQILTPLQQRSVIETTSESYDTHVMELARWMASERIAPARIIEAVDEAARDFFEVAITEHASASFGDKVLSGLRYRLPRFPGTVPLLSRRLL